MDISRYVPDGISEKTAALLKKNGINTIGQLVDFGTDNDTRMPSFPYVRAGLFALKGVGVKKVDEIMSFLEHQMGGIVADMNRELMISHLEKISKRNEVI